MTRTTPPNRSIGPLSLVASDTGYRGTRGGLLSSSQERPGPELDETPAARTAGALATAEGGTPDPGGSREKAGEGGPAPPPYFGSIGTEIGSEIGADGIAEADFGGLLEVRRSEILAPNGASFSDLGRNIRPEAEPFKANARAMGRRTATRRTGSRAFYDHMRAVYPATANPRFARLLVALLSPHDVIEDPNAGRVVLLGGHLLAACMGTEREYAEGLLVGDDATGAFLESFRDAVLPGLEWADYVPGERRRSVPLSHALDLVDDALLDAWRQETASRGWLEDRVYLDNGAAFSPANRSKERRRQAEAMSGYAEHASTALSGRLWTLLDASPASTFSPALDRLRDAEDAARSLRSARATADALDALRAIADDPTPRYRFSAYSVRLAPVGAGFGTVATPVRRALLSDCYEVDLASSQLAIAARDWGCPELYATLDTGESFWTPLLDFMRLGPEAKAAVKRGTYGLVYGAGKERIVSDIRAEFRDCLGTDLPERVARRFLDFDLVSEVRERRDNVLRAVREALDVETGRGYVLDVFGRPLSSGRLDYADGVRRPVAGPRAARSILAQLAQARELWLLEPLVSLAEAEAARRRPEWRIVLWQHDGASLRFSRRADLHLGRIAHAVEDRAREGGYPTRLEVKYDPDAVDIADWQGRRAA